MLDKTLHWIVGVVFCLSVIATVLPPALAANTDPKNPLKGMTAVEASKGLTLPDGGIGQDVAKGRYLVGLLGCASCHTDGALIGNPDPSKTLAGSNIGIAYSNPMVNEFPGAVYPPNLTPDKETGLGDWTLDDIVTLLRSGKTRHGRQTMAIMPWTSYAQLSNEDALAIASYLKSLPPIRNPIPRQVLPGNPTRTPLVHVGLYRSR
jgi:mono/diheme cytochrome c family protein